MRGVSAEAVEEVARIVGRICRALPQGEDRAAGQLRLARERPMTWYETNRVGYMFGLARNGRS